MMTIMMMKVTMNSMLKEMIDNKSGGGSSGNDNINDDYYYDYGDNLPHLISVHSEG